MKKYSESSICPKCHNNVIETKHLHIERTEHEVMERTCAHCGFSWWEEPLDEKTKHEN